MTDACSNLCGGRCCENFPISATPERLGELYGWAVARIAADEASARDWDVVTICEMVIRIDEPDEAEPRYTCRHLRAGLCSIHARRPAMCSEYPGYGGTGGACSHCGFRQPMPVERRLAAPTAS